MHACYSITIRGIPLPLPFAICHLPLLHLAYPPPLHTLLPAPLLGTGRSFLLFLFHCVLFCVFLFNCFALSGRLSAPPCLPHMQMQFSHFAGNTQQANGVCALLSYVCMCGEGEGGAAEKGDSLGQWACATQQWAWPCFCYCFFVLFYFSG